MVRREPGTKSNVKAEKQEGAANLTKTAPVKALDLSVAAIDRTLDHSQELLSTNRTEDLPDVGEGDCCGGCDFTLTDDYSHTTQGARHWHYLVAPPGSDEYDEMYPSEVTVSPDLVIKHWRYSKTDIVNMQARGRTHPSKNFDAVFAWDAPSDGVAKVSGTASDTDTRCGDGVHFIVKTAGGNVLWDRRSANEGDVHRFNVDAVLKKGEMLYFRASFDGAAEGLDGHDCDSASMTPTIAFQEACSTKSDEHQEVVDAATTGPDDDDDMIESEDDNDEETHAIIKGARARTEAMKAEATHIADDAVGAISNLSFHSRGIRAAFGLGFFAIPALALAVH